jgi:hypothetical protein
MGIDPAAAEKLWGCAVTLPALRQGSSLKRRVVTVADFTPTGAQEVAPSEVSKWLPESDGFEPTSAEELFERSPRLKSYAAYMKISRDTVVAEIETKLQILESLVRENITGYEEVAKTIAGIVAAERAVERWSA